MDESNQNAKPPMAAIDTSDKENIIDEIHLVLIKGSNTSSKNTSGKDKRQEERRNATSDSAYEVAIGASQSELEVSLETNATRKSEGFSHATDIINKDFPASKKLKSSHALLDGSNGQQNAPPQDNGTDMNLKVQELKSNMEANMSLKVKVITSTGDIIKKEGDEMKRERRKQANRESAKRLRFRKRQEREELEATANDLNMEVSILTKQLRTLSEDCAALTDEIMSTMDELEAKYGQKQFLFSRLQDLLLQ